jgi:hypothetical protein
MGSAWRRPSSARPTIADLDEPAHSVMAVLALATIIVVASAFFAVCGLRGYLRFRERAMEEAAYARAVLGADAFDFPA